MANDKNITKVCGQGANDGKTKTQEDARKLYMRSANHTPANTTGHTLAGAIERPA
jgi:hypothetical protein